MNNQLILVIGGARSGKSSYAEQRIRQMSEKRLYVATAPVCDEEMAARVRHHQEIRSRDGWLTIEEQIDLSSALRQANEWGMEAILIDCMTLWINNLLYRNEHLSENDFLTLCRDFLKVMRSQPASVAVVINEVGLGLVPESHLSRTFRDFSGRCAQQIAAEADEVIFLVAGIPTRIK